MFPRPVVLQVAGVELILGQLLYTYAMLMYNKCGQFLWISAVTVTWIHNWIQIYSSFHLSIIPSTIIHIYSYMHTPWIIHAEVSARGPFVLPSLVRHRRDFGGNIWSPGFSFVYVYFINIHHLHVLNLQTKERFIDYRNISRPFLSRGSVQYLWNLIIFIIALSNTWLFLLII